MTRVFCKISSNNEIRYLISDVDSFFELLNIFVLCMIVFKSNILQI